MSGINFLTLSVSQEDLGYSTCRVKQQKTGTTLLIPIHPELKLMLKSMERSSLLFLTTERGEAFSARLQGLVQAPMQTRRTSAALDSWPSQVGRRHQARQCRLHQRADQGDHRPQESVGGGSLQQGRRPAAAGAAGHELDGGVNENCPTRQLGWTKMVKR
jgi:hypothetical protein